MIQKDIKYYRPYFPTKNKTCFGTYYQSKSDAGTVLCDAGELC